MSKSNTCLTYAVSFTEAEAKSISSTQKLLCKVNARTKGPWTMSVKEIKKSENHYGESQEEEANIKGKQVYWLHILALECVKFVSVTCNALSNSQIGMLENPIICRLKLFNIVPN